MIESAETEINGIYFLRDAISEAENIGIKSSNTTGYVYKMG